MINRSKFMARLILENTRGGSQEGGRVALHRKDGKKEEWKKEEWKKEEGDRIDGNRKEDRWERRETRGSRKASRFVAKVKMMR
jgi:hypothetical protein